MEYEEFKEKIHELEMYKNLIRDISDVNKVYLDYLLSLAFNVMANSEDKSYIKKNEGNFITEDSVKFERSIDFDLKENFEFVNYTIKFSSMRPYERNAEEIFNRIKNDFKKLYK